jgi:hypothetical protein
MPKNLKDKMLAEVSDLLEENNVKVFDYPEFVPILANSKIPFVGTNKSKKIGAKFNYELELKEKKSID